MQFSITKEDFFLFPLLFLFFTHFLNYSVRISGTTSHRQEDACNGSHFDTSTSPYITLVSKCSIEFHPHVLLILSSSLCIFELIFDVLLTTAHEFIEKISPYRQGCRYVVLVCHFKMDSKCLKSDRSFLSNLKPRCRPKRSWGGPPRSRSLPVGTSENVLS